ncbi:MAG: glycosyltransferase [Lewinellaceae bacterium]|nr:glycosyltransferase [Saprospiraceae bacterium]MCB9334266.1 glycosyltransferase [Lewinellaceae bacterium]
MRIIWITPGFAADAQDSTCIPPLYLLAQEFTRLGIDLHILALEYPPGKGGTRDDGFAVYPCQGNNRPWLRWRTFYRARYFAQQIHLEKKVRVVHSFWLGPAWVVGRQISRRLNIPLLTTLMGQDVLPQNRYLKRLAPGIANQLVALSPFHQNALEKTCGLRAAHEIPWGIAGADIPAQLPAERPIDILGVGSLIQVKNWVQWLEVLRLINEKQPGVQAELIGEGPQLNLLKQQAERLGLAQHLTFAGSLPRPEVLERMRRSKVLLHTGHFESFGFVFAEGAANGCRVVSTPVGAAPAFGVCSETSAGLAAAVLQVLAQPDLQKPRVVYRMEDTAAAYLKLYGG